MNNVISVRNLTKTYKLYNSKMAHAAELFFPFGKRRHVEHHAIKDISFDVKAGDCLGIIGRNGSGKSTLLKILTGVLTPTVGSVSIEGNVSSLLELGAGFNPELTGRENIFFNGTLMGATSAVIEKRMDKIVSFADIGAFIDQPVKIYSSGMFVRLAFAVSIHVDPDILIIDEALAVGDVRFQKKCVDFMKSFKESGKTIVFVSHDIFTVKSFCNRLLLINDGSLEAIGDPDDVANRYYQIMFPKGDLESISASSPIDADVLHGTVLSDHYRLQVDISSSKTNWGNGAAWIKSMSIGGIREPNVFNWEDDIDIEIIYQWNVESVSSICKEQVVPPKILIGFRLENSQGWVITNFASSMIAENHLDFDLTEHHECVVRCSISRMKLASGNYFLTPGIAIGTQDNYYPVHEYTNLIHLYCDTKMAVLGQMLMDYSLDLVDLH